MNTHNVIFLYFHREIWKIPDLSSNTHLICFSPSHSCLSDTYQWGAADPLRHLSLGSCRPPSRHLPPVCCRPPPDTYHWVAANPLPNTYYWVAADSLTDTYMYHRGAANPLPPGNLPQTCCWPLPPRHLPRVCCRPPQLQLPHHGNVYWWDCLIFLVLLEVWME